MGKIAKPEPPVNLPRSREGSPVELSLEQTFRQLCIDVVRDPAATVLDRLRAMEALKDMRVPEVAGSGLHEFRQYMAGLSDGQLAEQCAAFLAPLHDRDPREVEREIEAHKAKLDAEFETKVEVEVRKLADPDEFRAQVERRAREITDQGSPLTLTEAEPPKQTRVVSPDPPEGIDPSHGWEQRQRERAGRRLGEKSD